jgi:hypothetical protein
MFSSIVHGQQYTEEAISNVTANGRNGSLVSALFVLGDSSVDCGDNTLFYPLLHGRLSLYPCNGSDGTLLPQIIGTSSFSCFLDDSFCICDCKIGKNQNKIPCKRIFIYLVSRF